jgi:hypothetical protein
MVPALLAALAESDRRLEARTDELQRQTPLVLIDHPGVTPRSITGLMIVCGDCAGEEPLPRKTLLAADGSCSTCGGGSYLLASIFFQNIPRRIHYE